MKQVRVFVPGDAAAVSVGADEVAQAIAIEAPQRKVDVELIRNGTRGMLWLEPLVEVETANGRIAYGPVTESDIGSLFEADFLNGGAHALSLGLTESIPYFAGQERLIFARCGVIDPLSLREYEAQGGLAGLRSALGKAASVVTDEVKASGLRGRGGAGFPTGIKWETVLKQQSDQKYICCNADEGDSGTFADRMLMEGDPFSIIEGMVIAGHAVGADTGYIYIRSEYPYSIKMMNAAIRVWKDAGLLGDNIEGTGTRFQIYVRRGAGAYICGEESSMLESLEGQRGQVRAKPPIPAISGLFGKPTIVNNVLTLASVPTILSRGAEYYQNYGIGRSRGTQAFQLAGDVACGGLVEKAFGITLAELVNEFGRGTRSGKVIKTAQVGGPLGAYIPVEKFAVEMGYEELAAINAMLGHGGIVIFNDTADMAAQARFAMEFCELESCGKCTPCRIGSTRGKETIDKMLAGERLDENRIILKDLCDLMTTASLCAMGGLTPMPVMSALMHYPEDFGLPTQHETAKEEG